MLSSPAPPPARSVCPVQLDHFRHTPAAAGGDDGDENTFQQRYYLCSEYWGPASGDGGDGSSSDGEGQDDSRRGNDAASASKTGRGGERAAPGALGPIFFYVSFSSFVLKHTEAFTYESHTALVCILL